METNTRPQEKEMKERENGERKVEVKMPKEGNTVIKERVPAQ